MCRGNSDMRIRLEYAGAHAFPSFFRRYSPSIAKHIEPSPDSLPRLRFRTDRGYHVIAPQRGIQRLFRVRTVGCHQDSPFLRSHQSG